MLMPKRTKYRKSHRLTYDGKAKNPAVTVKANGKALVEDKDYTVAYKNNKNVNTDFVFLRHTKEIHLCQ